MEVTGINSVNIIYPNPKVENAVDKDGKEISGKYKRNTNYEAYNNVTFRHLYRWLQAYKLDSILEKDPDEKKEYE